VVVQHGLMQAVAEVAVVDAFVLAIHVGDRGS